MDAAESVKEVDLKWMKSYRELKNRLDDVEHSKSNLQDGVEVMESQIADLKEEMEGMHCQYLEQGMEVSDVERSRDSFKRMFSQEVSDNIDARKALEKLQAEHDAMKVLLYLFFCHFLCILMIRITASDGG